jgi:hypothetical protein
VDTTLAVLLWGIPEFTVSWGLCVLHTGQLFDQQTRKSKVYTATLEKFEH